MAKAATKAPNGVKASSSSKKSSKVESKTALSQERVVDSDEDDSSEDESSGSGGGVATNSTTKDAVSISSREEEIEDESESDVSESSTEPSDSSEDEDQLPAPAPAEAAKAKSASKAAGKSPPSEPLKTSAPQATFEPPLDYSKLERHGQAAAIDVASLGSKQIWHIEVPAGMSLSEVTTLSRSALDSKAPVLSHKGLDYILTATHTGVSVLPEALIYHDPQAKTYRTSTTKISRSFRLHPKATLTSSASNAKRPAIPDQEPIRTVRPDPKSLRMRYKPPGFGAGRPGKIGSDESSSDDDMPDAPGFRIPTAATGTPGKRAAQEAEDEGATPAKLSKEERAARRARKAERAAKRAKQA